MSEEERATLVHQHPSYIDTWDFVKGSKENGYTYDSASNSLLRDIGSKMRNIRRDLILLQTKKGTWRPTEARLIGTTSKTLHDGTESFLSTHYGVLVQFSYYQ